MSPVQTLNTKTTLALKAGEAKTIYQDLNNPIKELKVDLAEDANLTLMLYNSACKIEADLLKNSILTIYNIAFCQADYEINMTINNQDTNANTHVINVYLGIQDSKLTSNIYVFHQAKSTTSLIETYAISKDNAKLVLNNNAKILNGMSASDARQLTKGLNLSANAQIKAQPNLYIDEYDVVASHSASIGSVDKEELFYLMSRGLTEAQAQEMVVLGFIQPILGQLDDLALQQTIYNKFINLLK